jgi:hypothetical protein
MDRVGFGRYECAVWLEHISKQVDMSPSISTENQDHGKEVPENSTSSPMRLISELELYKYSCEIKLAALGLDTRKLNQSNLVVMAKFPLKQVATRVQAEWLNSPATPIFDFGYG